MAKLSIIIPSRDEQFLTPTIDDIFRNARGECEVVAVLDSDKWPGDWKEVTARHPNLHTVHNGGSIGMRKSINRGADSAISRGADFIMKLDGHCALGEGFDEIIKAEFEDNWVVVPRRLRLEPESWTIAEPEKPPHDYHYLSFPDDPNDFGGPGLNGKPWIERTKARMDVLLDEEMSSQGSCWIVKAPYFQQLELMDHESWGDFWSEFQEVGLKCQLSGGTVMVNKKTYYAHLHKGKKYGRGYRLPESSLIQGRNHTMLWPWNEAWDKQTKPFEWLIDHFWPVPTWPENWREILYRDRKPRAVGPTVQVTLDMPNTAKFMAENPDFDMGRVFSGTSLSTAGKPLGQDVKADRYGEASGLRIIEARYGIGGANDIDVRERLQSLVVNDSLDIIVNNSTLVPGQNPFRGQKKSLSVTYSYNGSIERAVAVRQEKEALIIGQPQRREGPLDPLVQVLENAGQQVAEKIQSATTAERPMTPAALNDYLIRKFSISPYRLRAPMPIELPHFHRNDLAELFAELGFRRGAEIGVAEGNYSEVLLKANPDCELLLVDPWHAYSDNPQNKSKEKHEYAYNETLRKVKDYRDVKVCMDYSMNAVRDFSSDYFDFCYIDGNHLFDHVMQDLIEWSKRVRSGGIVSGDDYYALDQKRWIGGGVVEAVRAYTKAHQIPVWYIFQGHKSVDFMWVKP